MATQRRSTTTRDRHRARIRKTKPPCGICGQPIDYTLRVPNPAAFVVDHIVPIAKGGTDTADNTQAAHHACNRAKSDRTPAREFATTRTW